MSAYRVHESQIRLQDAILAAISDRICQYKGLSESEANGLVKENIEIHNKPQKLRGYQGDEREQKANIICPQDFVNEYLGGDASNDLGFIKKDNKYQAIVSDYDETTWWSKSAPRFWQSAQAFEAVKAAKLQGYAVKKTEENGLIKLTCLSRK
jgi:hypothetical protein